MNIKPLSVFTQRQTDRQTETDIMSITPKNSRYINSDASLEHLRVHC